MIRVPTRRQPTHPGEMLAEEFLLPMGISQRKLAQGINVSYWQVNEIVNQRRGVSPSMALRLARFFRTSGAFWMSLQQRWDLYEVQKAEAADLKRIRPHEYDLASAEHPAQTFLAKSHN